MASQRSDLELLRRELTNVLQSMETAHDKARERADEQAKEIGDVTHRELVRDAVYRGTFEGIMDGARHQLRVLMSMVWSDIPRHRG